MSLVELQNVTLKFGGLTAVNDVSFAIPEGSIISLIGPNGAGKTSVFNMITGFYRPTKGAIRLAGTNLVGKKPSRITQLGLARTFQNIRLFSSLTVLENVMSGMHSKTNQGIFGAVLHTPRQKREEAEIQAYAEQCMEFVGVKGYADRFARNLSYGVQRRVEIARALATKPKVLLLDEPAAGLNVPERVALVDLIRRIRDELNLTILLIEHDMALVNQVAERIVVLDYGQKIADGLPMEVLQNERVIEAYIGKEDDDEW